MARIGTEALPGWNPANDGSEGIRMYDRIRCMGRTFVVVRYIHSNGELTITAREEKAE